MVLMYTAIHEINKCFKNVLTLLQAELILNLSG